MVKKKNYNPISASRSVVDKKLKPTHHKMAKKLVHETKDVFEIGDECFEKYPYTHNVKTNKVIVLMNATKIKDYL